MKGLIPLVLALLISSGATANAEVSTYKDVDAMWELVSEYSPSDEITAAVVSQIYFESHCLSNAVGGGYLFGDGYDEEVTAAIDAGMNDGSTREGFVKHLVGDYQVWGYGLIQWVDPTECGKLYDFAAEKGASIGDAKMQIEFIFRNTKENFPDVWEQLLEAESAGDAAVIFAHWVGGTELAEKLEDRRWFAEELMRECGNGNQG